MKYSHMNAEQQKDLITRYLDHEIEVIKHLDTEEINLAVRAIVHACERGADIYVFGNGGSAATASHLAADLNYCVSQYFNNKACFICLSDNIPRMMAIANDISYDEVFRNQLIGRLSTDDLVIGISGSGNSKNVILAVEYARQAGAKSIGITGSHGGKLKELSDYHMDVMEDDILISEDIHLLFNHMVRFVMSQE